MSINKTNNSTNTNSTSGHRWTDAMLRGLRRRKALPRHQRTEAIRQEIAVLEHKLWGGDPRLWKAARRINEAFEAVVFSLGEADRLSRGEVDLGAEQDRRRWAIVERVCSEYGVTFEEVHSFALEWEEQLGFWPNWPDRS